MVTRLWNSTQHYRRAFVALGGRSRMWVVNAEHRLILDAVVRRDADRRRALPAGPHPAHPHRARPPPGRVRGGPVTRVTVNGTEVVLASDGDTPLLTALRDELGLVGSRFGCGAGPVRRLLRAPRRRRGAVVPDAAVAGRGPGRHHGRGAVRRARPAPRAAGDPRPAGRAVRLLHLRDRRPRGRAARAPSPDADAVRVAEALDRNLCRCGVAAPDHRRGRRRREPSRERPRRRPTSSPTRGSAPG